jgi:hypothetical protein
MMSNKLALILSTVMLATLPVLGDEWNKKTLLTFSQPVEVPGMILPAGDYVFKLADSFSNRHIVQIFNADEDQIFATILAIPNYRMELADKTIVLFEERRADQPQAIHAWFYPGNVRGQEFVYPKGRALELARETHQDVLSGEVRPTETPAELEKTPVVEVTPESKEVQVAEVFEPTPAPTPVPSAEPLTVAPEEKAAAEPELPKTASPLPLIGMLGMVAVGLAGLLKAVRARTS